MAKKRIYYGATTRQQRYVLFETWEETGSVTKACRKARVRRQTFYKAKENNWEPVVSPNTVKRILQDAGMWQVKTPSVKKRTISGKTR